MLPLSLLLLPTPAPPAASQDQADGGAVSLALAPSSPPDLREYVYFDKNGSQWKELARHMHRQAAEPDWTSYIFPLMGCNGGDDEDAENAMSDMLCVWHALDFSDGKLNEMFAIHTEHPIISTAFMFYFHVHYTNALVGCQAIEQ